jgi:hypothetical protein
MPDGLSGFQLVGLGGGLHLFPAGLTQTPLAESPVLEKRDADLTADSGARTRVNPFRRVDQVLLRDAYSGIETRPHRDFHGGGRAIRIGCR